MNPEDYTRNRKATLAALHHAPNKTLIAKRDLKITFPTGYVEKSLGSLDDKFNPLAVLGIVFGKEYGLFMLDGQIRLNVYDVNRVVVDQGSYYVLSYKAGDVICDDTSIVANDQLVYHIYYEFQSMGKTPWYCTPTDLMYLFDTAEQYAGVNLHADHAILELKTSFRFRSQSNRTVLWRHDIRNQNDYLTGNPIIVSQNNITWGGTNSASRVLGSNLRDGLNAALLHPSHRPESIETHLRK